MPLIIKKLVPVYKSTDDVPKRYLNLRKAVYVTTFKYPYPNMKQILINEYRLKSTDKVVVFWMKEVPKKGWGRFRLPFRKVYTGTVSDLVGQLRHE